MEYLCSLVRRQLEMGVFCAGAGGSGDEARTTSASVHHGSLAEVWSQ